MSANFLNISFPENISYRAQGGPTFSTNIALLKSKIEIRKSNWTGARFAYIILLNQNNSSDLQQIIDLFMVCGGKKHSFLFKDWNDFSVTNQYIASGNAIDTVFSFIKTYSFDTETYTRRILKPVNGSVTVYIDNVAVTTGLTIDYTNGTMTFNAAPLENEIITADFSFNTIVRFDSDLMLLKNEKHMELSAQEIRLIEVI